MPRRLTLEAVKEIFKKGGCELLESEYVNSEKPMLYKCECGERSKIRLYDFRIGHRCKKCGYKKVLDKIKLTIEYAKKEFEKVGYELLETEYKNVGTPMLYKCKCGYVSKIRLSDIKNGHKCRKCWIKKHTEKIKGKLNPNYNPNITDEERNSRRLLFKEAEYKNWRNEVYKRDNYTCQKCGIKGGKLNAHHMDGWNRRKDLRYKVDNGITLCGTHHREFHKIHGRGNNYKCQMDVFLDNNIAVFDFGNEGSEKYIKIA